MKFAIVIMSLTGVLFFGMSADAATGACFTDMSELMANTNSCAEYEADSDVIDTIEKACNQNPYSTWRSSCPDKRYGCKIDQPNIVVKTWFQNGESQSAAKSACEILQGKFLTR